MQALYAYFQTDKPDSIALEKNLNLSIERIYDLYLYELRLLHELRLAAEHYIELALNKKLPTAEDLNPNRKFVNNFFLTTLGDSDAFVKACEDRKINWSEERNIILKLYQDIKKSELFQAYLQSPENTWEEDKRIIRKIYDTFIVRNETFHQIYEDRNMHWADDLDAAQIMIEKTLRKTNNKTSGHQFLLPLYKDDEDRSFGGILFRKCLQMSKQADELIAEKAQNWEMDRIALIDTILMKMALAEFQHFSTVPTKVTMNEYIELSKEYSTPKSSIFINGILDKLLKELKEAGKISKVGRGLLES